MMFVGTKEYTVDDKGRVVLPPKYREKMDGEIIIFKDLAFDCIRVYPYKEYEKYIEELDNSTITDRNTEILLDRAIGRAESVQLDKQGRIMIPQKMRDSVGIEKDVLVIGKRKRFEIWEPKTYNAEYSNEDEAKIAYQNRFDNDQAMKMNKG